MRREPEKRRANKNSGSMRNLHRTSGGTVGVARETSMKRKFQLDESNAGLAFTSGARQNASDVLPQDRARCFALYFAM
jgi:hypothetical protein